MSNSILFRESFKANTFDGHQTLSEIKNHQKNQRNKIKKINKDLDKLNNLLNQSVVESFVGDTELNSIRGAHIALCQIQQISLARTK